MHAVRAIMSDENIQIDFDLPTEVELMELAVSCMADEDEEDEESEGFQPF